MARRAKENLKKAPGAGFSAKNPVFPAVVGMDADLGHTNQFILVNELAVRELDAQAQQCETGVEAYISSISNRHRVRVSLSQFAGVSKELPRWYTVLVFTAVDRTLRQLIKNIHEYKQPPTWKDRDLDRKLGALEQLAVNQPTGHKRIDSYSEYDVLEYYRLVRNEIVHPPRNRTRAPVAAHAELAKSAGYLEVHYQTRGAPNHPDSMTFDDFFLHTRIARDFAIVISDAYQLTIADILRVASSDQALLKKAKASGSASGFRNCYYDYYFKRYQRWNDATAIGHANSFADLALQQFR